MYMPVLVYSETDAVRRHADEFVRWGKRALIVTGRYSAAQCGALQDVTDVLTQKQMSCVLFDAIEENPRVSSVVKAAQFAADEKVDFVIGIGGGSPLDAAKAIAFLLSHPGNGEELLYQPGDDQALPLILIPTTCGTGSEVTPYSVLTIPERRTKKSIAHKIFAKAALIDGKYLSSAPLTLIRNTAMDALSHLIESYLHPKADDFSRMFAEGGFALFRKNRTALETGELTARQRQELMNLSAMAGMAIAQTSTSLPHGLSYALTYELHVPHGKAVGYFIAGFWQSAPERQKQELERLTGFESPADFRKWYRRWYQPEEVPDEILEEAMEKLLQNPDKLRTAPFPVSRKELREMVYDIKENEG